MWSRLRYLFVAGRAFRYDEGMTYPLTIDMGVRPTLIGRKHSHPA